jgi:C-terminal processing protease CtpA/Prc
VGAGSYHSLTMPSLALRGLTIILAVVTTAACRGESPSNLSPAPTATRAVANLRAFARLYGVVRWFHPSDAAAVIDWGQLAIRGAHRVADAADSRALRAALGELFSAIAPTMHIVDSSEPFPSAPAVHPESTAGLELVAWQHNGYGDSVVAADYVSKRRHRERTVAVTGELFATLSQSLDASPYRGAHIQLRGKLRAENHGQARLWLRVDRGEARGFFDNMMRRPVVSRTWSSAEISATVDSDATGITFGVLMQGVGTTWYDDVELLVQAGDGTWKPVESRGGFEGLAPLNGWRGGSASIDGWNLTADHDAPASGLSSLRIERATRVVTADLFDDAPAPGENHDLDLGSGLRARVPIALYSQAGHTIGDNPELAQRRQAAPRPAAGGFDVHAGVADVIVVWNVLQHFWPYWDMAAVDWDAELDAALIDALDDRTIDDHAETLDHLSAAAPDGHGRTVCMGTADVAFAPFAVEMIEGQTVVMATADPGLARGDVIHSVDGTPTAEVLARSEARISGSPQWRRARSLDRLGQGAPGSSLVLVVRRGTTERTITVRRTDRFFAEPPSHPAIERFDDGVYYVDLARASMSAITAILDRLAEAPGVVFDLRDRPNSNHQILSHLLDQPDTSNWMAIPHIIRPDSASKPSSWGVEGWSMPVLQPHIEGRVAFLTGPDAVSYSESVMGLVEHYRLGAIVGAATAGSNGDIAEIALPTGCNVRFTGRRVTKPDGSRHYVVGVQPTIPAARTIDGVIAGRDEVLEKALAHVRGGK